MTKLTFIGTLDGNTHELTVDDLDEDSGLYIVNLDGRDYRVDAHSMPSEIVTAIIDNKSYDIDLDKIGKQDDTLNGSMAVRVRGRVVYLDMLDQRRHKMRAAQASRFTQSGVTKITSSMPGKILRILVQEGAEVKEGQGLVIIEAMKMENEIKAPKAGVVKQVLVKPAEPIDGDTLLMVVD